MLDLRGSNSKASKGSTWRQWRVQENTRSGGLERFEIVDDKEQEFEIWMRRMARAKNQPYRASGWSREWKRKGYFKAVKFFETVGKEPGKTGRATLMIERARAFAKEMISGWL